MGGACFLIALPEGRGWMQGLQLSGCALRQLRLQRRRQSIFSLKEFLKPEPGLLGTIAERCEVASLVVVTGWQLHLLTFHTETQIAAARPVPAVLHAKFKSGSGNQGEKWLGQKEPSCYRKVSGSLFSSLCQAQIPHAKTPFNSQCRILP